MLLSSDGKTLDFTDSNVIKYVSSSLFPELATLTISPKNYVLNITTCGKNYTILYTILNK